VHDVCVGRSSPGAAFEILHIAQVNKLELTVIDASMAMQGEGPTDGTLVPMNLMLAGTSPLATDMVAARVMGFTNLETTPQFRWAHKLGMPPATLDDLELRGEKIDDVKRNFVRPTAYHWTPYSPEIYPPPKPKIEVSPDRKAIITWDNAEPIRRPQVEFTAEHKAFLTWTNKPAGPGAYLDRNAELRSTGWRRAALSAPGRVEFDMTQGTNQFFRLRKND
jgi:hypothetical protein